METESTYRFESSVPLPASQRTDQCGLFSNFLKRVRLRPGQYKRMVRRRESIESEPVVVTCPRSQTPPVGAQEQISGGCHTDGSIDHYRRLQRVRYPSLAIQDGG